MLDTVLPAQTSSILPSRGRQRLRPGAAGGLVVLALAVVLLWAWPPAGVLLFGLSLIVLGPWGSLLAERAIISTAVGLGTIAAVFSLMSTAHRVLDPLQWRVLATAGLVAIAVGVARRRDAPVWPRPALADLLALVGGSGVVVVLGRSLWGASPARVLGVLMTWWDNSSHLPIFTMIVHAQSWDLTRLGPDPMFYPYPSLHAATWAVIEWLAGVAPTTPGAQLVVPYAWLSVGTMGWAGAVFVWAAALLGRRVARPEHRVRAGTIAAWVTAVWVAFGAVPLIGLNGWANFILAAAMAAGFLVVPFAHEDAVRETAWFALPLAALAVAYLYTPIAGVLAGAVLAVASGVVREHRRALAGLVVVGGLAAAAALPALDFLVAPFHGEVIGALSGGVPVKGFWVPFAGAVIVVLGALVRHRRTGWASALSMITAMLILAATSWYFARQAIASNTSLNSSYYTQKALLAIFLVTVPLAVGLLSPTVATWSTHRGRPGMRIISRVAAVIAVLAATAYLPYAGRSAHSTVYGLGANAWHSRRLAATPPSRTDEIGRWILATAAQQAPGPTLTIAWHIDTHLTGSASQPLEADRVAAALDHFSSASIDPVYNDLSLTGRAGVAHISAYLRDNPGRNLRVVVPDPASVRALAPAVARFTSTRLQVIQS